MKQPAIPEFLQHKLWVTIYSVRRPVARGWTPSIFVFIVFVLFVSIYFIFMDGGQVRWALAIRSTVDPLGEGPRPLCWRKLVGSAPNADRGEGEKSLQWAWGLCQAWVVCEDYTCAGVATTCCVFCRWIYRPGTFDMSLYWSPWWLGRGEHEYEQQWYMDCYFSLIFNNPEKEAQANDLSNEQLKEQLKKMRTRNIATKKEHLESIKKRSITNHRQQSDNNKFRRQRPMCSPINWSEAYDSGFPKYFIVNMPERMKLCPFQLEDDIRCIIGVLLKLQPLAAILLSSKLEVNSKVRN